jgi:signal transduction histidine kinase
MRRVLWIDDDHRLLTPAAAALSAAGVTIVFATDLAIALDRLQAEAWNQVIIDVGIDVGDLERRHPAALEALGFGRETNGLDFARYLLNSPPPVGRAADSIIICSGFRQEYLQSVAPDLMAQLAYVSKAPKAFQENRFISEISAALDLHRDETLPLPPPISALELPYLDLYHDLKVAVRSSIPSLRRVAERLHEFVGGKRAGLDAAIAAVEGFGATLTEEAFSAPGVNASHLGDVEDVLAALAEKRANLAATSYIDLTQLSDKLLLKVARLPTLASTALLFEACRTLQTRLCAIEIDKVSARLLSEFSTPQSDAGVDSFSFDSSAILNNILDIEEPNAMACRAQFDRHIAPTVMLRTEQPGQSHLFRRALTNIIDNAIKYQGRLPQSSTWIIVRHFARGNWCVTSVENWGAPIHPEEIEDIFARGRRGEMARRQGDGQGLAIAFGCVSALGGSIIPKSVRGSRSNATNTFTVRLPLTPPLDE